MILPQSQMAAESSLGRDVLYATRYYLRNRWVLVALAGLAIALGLYFGGWGWLVAAGLAPILLSTLPCLIMCAFGVCMMCRSNKTQSAASRDAADSAASTAAHMTNISQPAIGGASCCHAGAAEPKTAEVKQVQSVEKKEESHA
jgi:hypothetical protein